MSHWKPTLLALAVALALGGCSQRDTSRDEGDSQTAGTAQQSTTTAPATADATRGNTTVQPEAVPATQPAELFSPTRGVSPQADMAVAATPSTHRQLKRHPMHPPIIAPPPSAVDRDNYAHLPENGVYRVVDSPVSTFSIDVDTGSYANMRRYLNQGRLPVGDAIRIEELINYFDYHYPVPDANDAPFSVTTEMAPAPWHADRQLLKIGLKGYQPPPEQVKAANLVFLVDVSGSMTAPNKLPLLKQSLSLLTSQLSAADSVAIVTYAGRSAVALEHARGNDSHKITAALEQLQSGGSTHGSAGIQQAYALAKQHFVEGGINRVILATDGDFNVGTVNLEALKEIIRRQRDQGISLTTLGFGAGNYNDHLMEQLADIGNGNYAYIDTLNEARKVLVDEVNATLQTIARDVKIQLEFNPARVAEYRLIGYENRLLAREDFNNDKVDAGDIGAGHTVTALYELTLIDSPARRIDPLRYAAAETTKSQTLKSNEIGYLRLRYKTRQSAQSALIETPIRADEAVASLDNASDDFRFAAAVAAFGQLLKGGRFTENISYQSVLDLAKPARGDDTYGYRSEFLQLVRTSQTLAGQLTKQRRPTPSPRPATR